MSQSVSKALECVIGADSKATANFIDIVDKMFDCLNVRNLTDGKKSRKTFQAPYRSGRDFRLQVCHSFMIYRGGLALCMPSR